MKTKKASIHADLSEKRYLKIALFGHFWAISCTFFAHKVQFSEYSPHFKGEWFGVQPLGCPPANHEFPDNLKVEL